MYPFYETFLGCVDIPTTWPIVERAGIGIPSHLHPTIYMSEPGATYQTLRTGWTGSRFNGYAFSCHQNKE